LLFSAKVQSFSDIRILFDDYFQSLNN